MTIKQFLRDYLRWVEEGAPEGDSPFSRSYGLCGNLVLRCGELGLDHNATVDLAIELRDLLPDDRESWISPFNGSLISYSEEVIESRCHLNEARIAWVRENAE